jgi:hypothetical protein
MSTYDARNLLVLEGLEAVRKRPGMYVGSTDTRGLMHCLWEIVDNAVDEALGGHCTHIEVDLHADGSVEVRDDGRGIPVDVEPRTGLTGVEVVMTRLHAGEPEHQRPEAVVEPSDVDLERASAIAATVDDEELRERIARAAALSLAKGSDSRSG